MFENLKNIFKKPTVDDLIKKIEDSAISVTEIPSLVEITKPKQRASIVIKMQNKMELEYSCSNSECVTKWKEQAENLMNGKNETFGATIAGDGEMSLYDYVKHEQVTHIRILTPVEFDLKDEDEENVENLEEPDPYGDVQKWEEK